MPCFLRSSLHLLSLGGRSYNLQLHRPLVVTSVRNNAAQKDGTGKLARWISGGLVTWRKESSLRQLILGERSSRPLLLLDLHGRTSGSRGLQTRATGGRNGDGGGGGGGGGKGGGGSGSGGESGSVGRSGGASEVLGIFAWYLKMLESHPVKAKALTAALLTFLGDLFCQFVVEKSDSIDLKRIGVISVLGLLLVGPTLHFWYLILSKIVVAGGTKGAGIRLLLDQFIFAPIFIAVFFTALLTLEGRPSDIIPKLYQDWRPAVIANWKIWIPFQFLNFLFVPQQLQVGAANLISLGWNVYLSFATHTDVSNRRAKQSISEEG